MKTGDANAPLIIVNATFTIEFDGFRRLSTCQCGANIAAAVGRFAAELLNLMLWTQARG